MFLTRIGLVAIAFAAVYSFFGQPILSLFGWATATYSANPSLPAGVAMPGLNATDTSQTMPAGFTWWDLLYWVGTSIIQFLKMTAGGTVTLFYSLGDSLSASVPDPQAATVVKAFFTGLGALLQVSMWWTIVYAVRGGQV